MSLAPGNIFNRVTLIGLFLAVFGWGSWAFYTNLINGDYAQAIRSALTQATFSGVMTIYMAFSVRFFYEKFKGSQLANVLPVVLTIGHTMIFSITAHTIAQTPHIFRTIAPPFTIATLFCIMLTRKNRQQNQVAPTEKYNKAS